VVVNVFRWTPTLVVVVVLAACGADQNDYIAQNERLLAELPQFPNAVQINEQHLEIEDTLGDTEFAWRTAGYSTHVAYGVPRSVSDIEIVRYFDKRLRHAGWEGHVSQVDGIPVACYVRGSAFVSISTDGMDKRFAGPWSFEIGLNHNGGAPSLC
jgi:hypothetical protein